MNDRTAFVVEVGGTAVILALIWRFTQVSDNFLVVPLFDILRQFQETWLFDRAATDLLPSLKRAGLGYLGAVVIGVTCGLAIGINPLLRGLVSPIVSFMRAIPPVALLAPAIILLGIGDTMRIAIVAFVCVWPILMNTTDGVASLDETMHATARVYRLGLATRLRLMIIPAVSPRILAGMRTSLSLAILLMIVSEMVASTNGVGRYLLEAQQRFAMDDMWAAIILLGLLGYATNFAFVRVERRVVFWVRDSAEGRR